jgi:hypothetical protein
MADKREDILRKCDEETNYLLIGSDDSVIGYDGELQPIYNAMDENARQMCLDLLEYVVSNVRATTDGNGECKFLVKNEWITKEQLFENFL